MKKDMYMFIGLLIMLYLCLFYSYIYDLYIYKQIPLDKKVYDPEGIYFVKDSWLITIGSFTYYFSLIFFFIGPLLGLGLLIKEANFKRVLIILIGLVIFYFLFKYLDGGGYD